MLLDTRVLLCVLVKNITIIVVKRSLIFKEYDINCVKLLLLAADNYWSIKF